jgi:hypothetical protein
MDSAGDLAVAWTCNDTGSAASSGICAQVFAPDGTAKTAVLTVDQGPAASTNSQGSFDYTVGVVMAPNGDFTVGWSGANFYGTGGAGGVIDAFTTNFIKTRRYNSSGEPYSAANIAAFKAFLFSKTMRFLHVSMVGSPSGSFLVTWLQNGATEGKFFSAEGKRLGGTTTILNKGTTALAFTLTNAGDVVYVYPETSSSSPGSETLYLQRCSSACTSTSAPVEVGTRAYPSSPNSGGLALSTTSDGGAFVTWGDPSTNAVVARAFSPDAVALSAAFPVGNNPLPLYYNYGDANLSAAIDSNGNLVVAWGSLMARVFQGE